MDSDIIHTSHSSEMLDLWTTVYVVFLSGFQELIASLPEEWQPGPTFYGLPWKSVVVTAAVGIFTIFMFFWKTVLAVKSRTYILTEKQLAAQIQQLVNEKSDVLFKITELNNMIKQREEKFKNSENAQSSTQKEFDNLKTSYNDICNQREEMTTNFCKLSQKVENSQKENTTLKKKISIMHQEIEKYQNTLKLYDDDCSKVKVLLDEAKLREDALNAQILSFEKDNTALKEQKKALLRDAKDWKEKHEKLSEEIKVYHISQKELEDSLVHKDNEIDVLSDCIAELQSLEACDRSDQQGDSKVVSGEAVNKKGDHIKLRLKQMTDVSRIKTTLSVIEDERNRCLENYLTEQKTRQELEEKFHKVLHDLTNLSNDKTHLENQYKNLQQRLEITTELYQQKENALQQKLTQEELERRDKESKLTEVDGRAVQAEEELKSLKQKVRDMQDELQQNERALKAEIAAQEKKAHENWLKARASERALIEERRESANLRQKIVECSDKMANMEHCTALHKSGAPGHHMAPLRRGDSFGPSPVSCGAPSPPLMIEGPGRPPSVPVGRRNEPFGPRPPSDAHGRFSDIGHPLPSQPEVFAPRTSSPCTQNGSQTTPVDTNAEASMQAATDSPEAVKSQSQESFLPSPVRDSPVTALNAPPKAFGSQTISGPYPPLPNGPVPPMIRPPNGHPPMIPPRLPYGLLHMDSCRPLPPLRPFAPIPPPFVHGLPPRDHPSIGPLPLPPFGLRDYHPDYAGPRDLHFPPRPFPLGPMLPPGAKADSPYLFHGQDPPLSQLSMTGEETPHVADFPPQQMVTQSTATSTVAEP